MPQLRYRGKFVYGWSVVRECNLICFPLDVVKEYLLEEESDIILFSGSEISGGFCVSKLDTLKSSRLSNIIRDNPILESDEKIGQIVKYKGRYYCHLKMNDQSNINLSEEVLDVFNLGYGDKLLVIRGSNVAFDCIVKGPLVEVANNSVKQLNIY